MRKTIVAEWLLMVVAIFSSACNTNRTDRQTENDSVRTGDEYDISSQRDSTIDTIGDSIVDTSGMH